MDTKHEINDPDFTGIEKTVVYIEDNPANTRLVSRMLTRRPSVRLLTAEDAAPGLDIVGNAHPDLVLLDINLPEMSGFEVLKRIRELPGGDDIPVVALSANAMPSDIELGKAAGFNGYLTKPIDIKTFFDMVDNMLHDTSSREWKHGA